MRTIIIDDDKKSATILHKKLQKSGAFMLVGTATSADEGIRLAKETLPEVVFLDVELPDMTGIEAIRQIIDSCDGNSKIVMYTAHNKYMLSAFRNFAFDFLLKPIDDNELQTIISRLQKETDNKEKCLDMKYVRRATGDSLLLQGGETEFQVVTLNDICLFRYNHEQRQWEAVVSGHDTPLTMKRNVNNAVILGIDNRFIQVSQKYIININCLMQLNDNMCSFYPPFDHIDYVNVGRLYRKKIRERFNIL